jgi:hypothetical protein
MVAVRRVVICVRSLTHSLARRARTRPEPTARARERKRNFSHPPRRFIHSFKKEPRFRLCRCHLAWRRVRIHRQPRSLVRSQQPPPSRRGSPALASAKTPAAEHRFLKTQLMLFGIGLCQIFDDPDLRQQPDREPAANITAQRVCSAHSFACTPPRPSPLARASGARFVQKLYSRVCALHRSLTFSLHSLSSFSKHPNFSFRHKIVKFVFYYY